MAIIRICPALHHKVARPDQLTVSSRALRRSVDRVRRQVLSAPDAGLLQITRSLIGSVRRELIDKGYPVDMVETPDAEQLRDLLLVLPRPIAVVAFLGLLMGRTPQSELARKAEPTLSAALGLTDGEGESVNEQGLVTWAEIDTRLQRLETEAEGLVEQLHEDAEHIDSGRLPTDATATAGRLVDYATSLRTVLDAVTRLTPDAESLDDLHDVRVAREEYTRRADEHDRREQLLAERDHVIERMAGRLPSVRTAYAGMLATIDRELAELGHVVVEAPIPPVAAESAARGVVEESPARAADVPAQAEPADVAVQGVPADDDPGELGAPQEEPAPVVEPVVCSGAGPIEAPPTAPEPAANGEQPAQGRHAVDSSYTADVRHIAEVGPAPDTDLADTVDPMDTEATTAPSALDAAFPWESGKPPLVVDLVQQRRIVEAYWVTSASDESPVRAEVLLLAAAAFDAPDAAAAADVLLRWNAPDEVLGGDYEASLVSAAALLRCGLSAGWSSHYIASDAVCANLPVPWADLVRSASSAVQLRYQLGGRIDGEQPSDPAQDRIELGRTVRRLRDELPARTIKFQRATRVRQRLLQHGQPLGKLLEAIIAWSGGSDIEAVRIAVAELSADPTRVVIDADNVLGGAKKREAIMAGALEKLLSTIRETLDRGREAITTAERLDGAYAGAAEAGGALLQAARAARHCTEPPSVGGAALRLLVEWVLQPTVRPRTGLAAPRVTSPADAVPEDALLVVPDLPRDEQRHPMITAPDARRQLSALAGEPDPAVAVGSYVERGAIDLAERLVDLMPLLEEALVGGVKEGRARWCDQVAKQRAEVGDLLAKLRIQDLLTAEDIAYFSGRMVAPGHAESGAFDLATADLVELAGHLQSVLSDRARFLREQAGAVKDPELRKRIDSLLDDGDTIIANELLALDQEGKSVPDRPTVATVDLTEFLTVAAEMATSDAHTWAEAFQQEGVPLADGTGVGLDAWNALANPTNRSDSSTYTGEVRSALRLLGLDIGPNQLTWATLNRHGVRPFDARATPRDPSIVPELGSEAKGHYRVLVVVDDRRGRSLLDDVDAQSVNVPQIVLHLRPMNSAMRAEVADEVRMSQANVIVVDPAVVGWVAARAPWSFRATQRLTLPWSGYVPYRPAGLVPPEVFVGREIERRNVVAPNGGIFVYGGRQLGKSALLRQIEADPGDDRIAIYLDLKARSIGEAERPEQIWAALAAELKQKSVISEKVSHSPEADVVIREIQRWLDAHEHKHLLVLADESDSFLTADAQGVSTLGGVHHFPNVMRLKQLMESSHRRFKVVFAGLHQVQRFRHLSNVPIPHGGEEILIGPLDPRSATKLVLEPMAALGYRFERPEVVWRLLAATNYQPAPTQIFCMALLAHLRSRHRAAATVPVTITAQDVDEVAADDGVRERIAKLARITIDLDDRYRVLALLIAAKSLDDGFSRAYPVVELLDEVRGIWPEGFEAIDESALDVYLHEMEGLGLLTHRPDGSGYSVRSPNVVSMLGTREDFRRELVNSVFNAPYEYNPRFARRLLRQAVNGLEERSPLTDAELEDVVAAARGGALPIVVGTDWLTVDRLPDALDRFLDGMGESVVRAGPADVKRRITDAARRRGTWIVADLRGASAEDVVRVVAEVHAVANIPTIAMIGPNEAAALSDEDRAGLVRPSRWTVDSIRAWHECPFETPEQRRQLIAATGGWPPLIERVIAHAKRHEFGPESAIESVSRMPGNREQAIMLLGEIGVDERTAEAIAYWALASRLINGQVELIARADVSAFVEVPRGTAAELLDRLSLVGALTETDDGIALDEVTYRCLITAHGES